MKEGEGRRRKEKEEEEREEGTIYMILPYLLT